MGFNSEFEGLNKIVIVSVTFKNSPIEYLQGTSRNYSILHPNSNPNANFNTKSWRILQTDCNNSNSLCRKFCNILLVIIDFEKLKETSFISVEHLNVFLTMAYENLVKKQWSVK